MCTECGFAAEKANVVGLSGFRSPCLTSYCSRHFYSLLLSSVSSSSSLVASLTCIYTSKFSVSLGHISTSFALVFFWLENKLLKILHGFALGPKIIFK